MQGARIEQGGCGAHEIEGRKNFVEFDRALFTVDFVKRQAHGDTHEKYLRQLDAAAAQVQEVAVVQGLQAQVVELQITFVLQGGGQFGQVELGEFFVEQAALDAGSQKLWEVFGIAGSHIGLGDRSEEHTSVLQSLMRISYAVFCLKKKTETI